MNAVYIRALLTLRDEINREVDQVQVSEASRPELVAQMHIVELERRAYVRDLSANER